MKRMLFPIVLFAVLACTSAFFTGCSGENPMMPGDEDLIVGKSAAELDIEPAGLEFATVTSDTTAPPPDKKPDPEVEEVTWGDVHAMYR